MWSEPVAGDRHRLQAMCPAFSAAMQNDPSCSARRQLGARMKESFTESLMTTSVYFDYPATARIALTRGKGKA
jgi:hypothetical protein